MKKPENNGDRLLTGREAARRLRVHPDTMLKWLKSGAFPGRKIGKLWRVPAAEVERLEQGQ